MEAIIKVGVYSLHCSDLYWKVHKVYYIGEHYVKLKMTVYYKSNDQVFTWLNPNNVGKNFKIIKSVAQYWEYYDKKFNAKN